MQPLALRLTRRELPYRSPLSVLRSLKDLRYCFLLESSKREPGRGRFSFIGCNPFLTIRYADERVEVSGVENYEADSSPFDVVKHFIYKFSFQNASEFAPFMGGAVGYFSYDLRLLLERLPNRNVDDLQIPGLILCFYDSVLSFDHQTEECRLNTIHGIRSDEETSKIEQIVSRINVEDDPPIPPNRTQPSVNLRATWAKPDYVKAVQRAKEYISAGDIFQANLSQRFDVPIGTESFDLYRRLREANPSPFAAYLDFGDLKIFSASPERFLNVKRGRVETRPIKGTRPRGRNADEDMRLARELASSEKDRAENLMIVDLLRNDLGRVCEYGSVEVPELFKVEAHPTVFHLVSTVTGRLRNGLGCVDLLQVCFPGGSVTGAPKIRAMEIIDELEPVRRSVYTGCMGYLGFNGNMDMNIAIRTIVTKGGMAHFHVGSGIVADSDPEAEYAETIDKGRGLMQALQVEPPT